MVTSLRDIASELDVSVSLVSKVLSGRMSTSGASPRMIQAIRQKAGELGYQRNRTATALVTGRQEVIGVFLHQVGAHGSGVTESLIQGISTAAAQAQQRLWLELFRTNEEFRRRQPEIHRGEVDGMIIAGVLHEDLLPEMLSAEAAGVPVVTIHERQVHPKLPNAGSAQAELCRLGAEHLIEQGVRRPVHIAATDARAEGFRQAVREHGLPRSDGSIFWCGTTDYTYAAGGAAVEHWLSRGVAFDGIVAQSDQQALGAMHALLRRGVSIPRDVRLVGVDDSPVCQCSVVPLSSVCERYEERGRRAVELLLKRMAGEAVESILVPPTLSIRASSRGEASEASAAALAATLPLDAVG